jgi:homoserine dehydrogenase
MLDAGRIHYEFIAYLGCRGPQIDAAFGPERNRSELRAGGVAWIAGAGGPMGRMHVQRALQLADGPRTVVATNRGAARLAELARTFGPLAQAHGTSLGYSATVCGALPVINIGQRDLVAADITTLAGIFNATTNFILAEMGTGRSFADALAEAQQRGIAETDPTLDVEGWDTANKLVIIANSFLGISVTLSDVKVQGITQVTAEDLRAARMAGNTIKLVARAERTDGGYALSVRPTIVPLHSFLGQCDGWEMGIELQSDLYGLMFYKIWEREPLPTAAAMLRDAVNLLGRP